MAQEDASSAGYLSGRHSSRTSTPAGRRAEDESSTPGSFMHSNTPRDTGSDSNAHGLPLPRNPERNSSVRHRDDDIINTPESHKGQNKAGSRSSRHHKARSTGGFLLQDTVRNTSANEHTRSRYSRQSRQLQTPQSTRTKSLPRTSDKSTPNAARDSGNENGLGLGVEGHSADSTPSPTAHAQDLIVKKRPQEHGEHNGGPAERSSPQRPGSGRGLNMDSAQIVSMALNLSESRRMASRRGASQAMPPTLAPLPDGTGGGSLRQHLQQQRRTSRNISPRPDRGFSPRISSGVKMNSPVQTSFDFGSEGSYRYQFSQSTLARAQKAKEHIELMAQYRRVLGLVPPLEPSARPNTSASVVSHSLSRSSTVNSADGPVQLGRPYNPLQYIRNRKVRARERKGIDGAAQGFAEVKKVTDWVDDVARWAATGQSTSSGTPTLPPFADADALAQQGKGAANLMRPKRPRVDWVIDPADMVADVYWLEQDHHLQLIEDRHWRRIFPQIAEPPKPKASHSEAQLNSSPESHNDQQAAQLDIDQTASHRTGKPEPEQSQTNTRERARQKLEELKTMHRHSSSSHSHDFIRFGRSSPTDVSDSEDEEETRDKTGLQRTFTRNNKDILEKQMLEMLARESRESSAGAAPSNSPSASKPLPDRPVASAPRTPPRGPSRKASITNTSETDEKAGIVKAHSHPATYHHIPGRPSLDVPMGAGRSSLDIDTSIPNSPESHPVGESPFIPAIGADLSSPPSRAGSPSRNPFHKVKSIFRERSRDRGAEPRPSDKDAEVDNGIEARPALAAATGTTTPPRRTSIERRGSESSAKKGRGRSSVDIRRDAKTRNEEAGHKGILKGARIDNVIRGGVSRLGDFIWRKDTDQTSASQATPTPMSENEDTYTEESDTEQLRRGRRRRNGTVTQATGSSTAQEDSVPHKGKHYLDVMPTFHHASHDRSSTGQADETDDLRAARPQSSRSARFELLKPPRIDVQHPSPSLSPVEAKRGRDEPNFLEEKADDGSPGDRVKEADRRLNSVISVAPSSFSGAASGARRHSSLAASFDERRWSLSGRSPSPHRAPVSRREIARLRAMALSSGVLAMEIARRAHEPQPVFAGAPIATGTDAITMDTTGSDAPPGPGIQTENHLWSSIANISTDPSALRDTAVAPSQLYQAAAQALSASVALSGQEWQSVSDTFASDTAPNLHAAVEDVRRHIAVDLSAMTRAAADDADETNRDLAHGQRLKVKHVVDVIEKMLRRRRRRFRWLRRGMWLGVEWVLVGFMWYVWFVVMIARIFWGVGKGVIGAARWLLWL